MSRPLLILRPRPGADRTAARAAASGLRAVVAPLFRVRPLPWDPPPADPFDAIIMTSANAARHGGAALAAWRHLPCYAVGPATAAAARDAGFGQVRIGHANGAALVRQAAADGVRRAFHPCGLHHRALAAAGITVVPLPVYAAAAEPRLPREARAALEEGAVALLHSPRAGELFARLVGEGRERVALAAISDAVAAAAGDGWERVAVAAMPRDQALLELAAELCQTERAANGAGATRAGA